MTMEAKIWRGREYASRYKRVFILMERFFRFFPLKVRKKLFEKKRFTKGLYGIGIRYVLLKSIAQTCGDNIAIFQGVYILNPEKLSMGNNVSIHPMTYIEAKGGISIGDNVSIAHGVTIISTKHNYQACDIPIKDQIVTCETIRISNNVWIGAKATVLCGNTIGTGSVVGAGAVVTKDIEEHTVNVGVPARVVKKIKGDGDIEHSDIDSNI